MYPLDTQERRSVITVNLAAMSYLDNQNDEALILKMINGAVITHADVVETIRSG